MTHILNILICLSIFATIHVATNDTSINQLIQGSSDSNHNDKISDLEKIVLDLASRLQVVESKNQVLDNKNKDLTQKLAHHDKLLKDVTSREHEFKYHDCICKENYELRSKIEDIDDEFQKHLTSSQIRFSVLEQLIDEYNTTSDTRYAKVEEHFSQVDGTIGDHTTTLGEIASALQDVRDPIVFSAWRMTNNEASSGNYLTGFDGFLTNYGSCFDLVNGIFTPSRQGVYEFSAAIFQYSLGPNTLIIEKQGTKVLEFHGSYGTVDDIYDTLSFTWIMELKQGETVRLRVGDSGKFDSFSDAYWVFSGKYIRHSMV